jgi:hypothetical protein
VGPRAGLDIVSKSKIPSPRRESNTDHAIVQPVASRYTCGSSSAHNISYLTAYNLSSTKSMAQVLELVKKLISLWKLQCNYHVHNTVPMDLTLRLLNTVCPFKSYFSKIRSEIMFPSLRRSPTWLLSLMLLTIFF